MLEFIIRLIGVTMVVFFYFKRSPISI